MVLLTIADLKKAQDFLKGNDISIPEETFNKVIVIIRRLTTPSFKNQLKGVFSEIVLTIGLLSNRNEIFLHLLRRCYWQAIEYFKRRNYLVSGKWFVSAFKFCFLYYIYLYRSRFLNKKN